MSVSFRRFTFLRAMTFTMTVKNTVIPTAISQAVRLTLRSNWMKGCSRARTMA